MEALNLFGLLGIVIVNASAVMIAHIKQQKNSRVNYGIKNGRGDLFCQVGKLQDSIIEIRGEVAELKGLMRGHIESSQHD
jgi:hypothetical protein